MVQKDDFQQPTRANLTISRPEKMPASGAGLGQSGWGLGPQKLGQGGRAVGAPGSCIQVPLGQGLVRNGQGHSWSSHPCPQGPCFLLGEARPSQPSANKKMPQPHGGHWWGAMKAMGGRAEQPLVLVPARRYLLSL